MGKTMFWGFFIYGWKIEETQENIKISTKWQLFSNKTYKMCHFFMFFVIFWNSCKLWWSNLEFFLEARAILFGRFQLKIKNKGENYIFWMYYLALKVGLHLLYIVRYMENYFVRLKLRKISHFASPTITNILENLTLEKITLEQITLHLFCNRRI